jgi:hypothetical protein
MHTFLIALGVVWGWEIVKIWWPRFLRNLFKE